MSDNNIEFVPESSKKQTDKSKSKQKPSISSDSVSKFILGDDDWTDGVIKVYVVPKDFSFDDD